MEKDANTDFGSEYFEHVGAVLPCQVRPALNPMLARSGERLLMLALLADAINIFLKGATERRLLAETRNWIRGSSAAYQAVSFDDACDALGIDPTALRERLFRLKYGVRESEVGGRRSSLMLKPPGVSRGPVKVGAGTARRTSRRRRVSS
jgi:hypothetical protein